jgi:hypothetical protein
MTGADLRAAPVTAPVPLAGPRCAPAPSLQVVGASITHVRNAPLWSRNRMIGVSGDRYYSVRNVPRRSRNNTAVTIGPLSALISTHLCGLNATDAARRAVLALDLSTDHRRRPSSLRSGAVAVAVAVR